MLMDALLTTSDQLFGVMYFALSPDQQITGPSPEMELAQAAVGKISIDPKIKQEMLAASNLAELYQQAGTSRRQGGRLPGSLNSSRTAHAEVAAAADSAAAAVEAAAGRLTYQRLAASRPMQKASAVVVQQLLHYMEQLYKHSSASQQHSFEIAVLIDNSGSMARLAVEAKQALVLLGEVLRHLELKFALVRFGRAHGQVVLKQLQQPFSAQVMQLALEALTWDEGTYPASACDFVAREVFRDAETAGQNKKTSSIKGGHNTGTRMPAAATADDGGEVAGEAPGVVRHRLVLAIVDGLTQEMRAEVNAAAPQLLPALMDKPYPLKVFHGVNISCKSASAG
jgi:hypothetical protein